MSRERHFKLIYKSQGRGQVGGILESSVRQWGDQTSIVNIWVSFEAFENSVKFPHVIGQTLLESRDGKGTSSFWDKMLFFCMGLVWPDFYIWQLFGFWLLALRVLHFERREVYSFAALSQAVWIDFSYLSYHSGRSTFHPENFHWEPWLDFLIQALKCLCIAPYGLYLWVCVIKCF